MSLLEKLPKSKMKLVCWLVRVLHSEEERKKKLKKYNSIELFGHNSVFITYNSKYVELIEEFLFSRIFEWCFHHSNRIEHLTWPTRKLTWPVPTQKVLGGSENIQVGFRVLFSGYYRVWVGIGLVFGSYKHPMSEPDFCFFGKKKENPTFVFLSSLSLFLKGLNLILTSQLQASCSICLCLSHPSLCKS